ncbi:MAG: tRNA (N(6)-L-threonylcarbamoyladenosine(37)-C(2))-methylthiotransferase MtaB [Bacteroidetes bacterium]|nr:tRNA (N(6)-L-threonylcarbamoyladenosine(37)-C(2))-methylthiotransferase MtaB [Bacteroidota bacterium]
MQKVAFHTLGCKLNFSETSSIARQFEGRGFKRAEIGDSPDVVIINTCSVTENADKECRYIVRKIHRTAPDAFIIMTGCFAQLKPEAISKIPGVDAVLGSAEKFNLFDLLPSFQKNGSAKVITTPAEELANFNASYSIGDHTRSFLKIQDGCDYFCSFCTIPLARGKSRSDTIENVVRQAKEIAAKGIKEIVLTGVNIGDFEPPSYPPKGGKKNSFLQLIMNLETIPGIERFRISSIEPNLLTDDIIEFVAQSKKFMPHFHIPLQSGSDKILKLMRRRYKKELFAGRVITIKNLIPYCCIGVDVITGFPGETEDDFLATYLFLNELDISYLHVFTYSERENTVAAGMKNKVPVQERQRRTKMLINLSYRKRRVFYEQHLGTARQALFEGTNENGKILGFTDNYIRVKINYDSNLINSVRTVSLKSAEKDGTVGAHV